MTELISWGALATYGGALTMVMVLTQVTKDFSILENIPTQILSYILALIVLILETIFTDGLSLDIFSQTLLNAVIISIAAN